MPTLVIQQGHCYRKRGATGTAGEQEFATAVAVAARALLHGRAGWTVRAIQADEQPSAYIGDAFVAVHCDGSVSSAARGSSVGYRNAAGQAFGQAFKRAYVAHGWPAAGWRPDNYTTALALYYGTVTAIAKGNTRAIIIECGFLTSPDDRAIMTAADGATRVARAIGDALGITYTEDDVASAQEIAGAVITALINFRPADNRNLWDIGIQGLNNDAADAARDQVVLSVLQQLATAKGITVSDVKAAFADGFKAAMPSVDALAAPIVSGLTVAVLPHLADVVRQVVGRDDEAVAEAIIDALGDRLASETVKATAERIALPTVAASGR